MSKSNVTKIELMLEIESLKREVESLKIQKKRIGKGNGEDSAFFKHLLENIPTDLVVFDPEHRYLYINPVAVKDQETREWLVGKTDYDYCKRRGKDFAIADTRREQFNKAKLAPEGVFYQEKMLDSHGKDVWNLRRMFPITDEKGQLQYVVGYATNITHLKATEKDLEKATKRAEVSMRVKEEFLANMSHEIRTPMNAILGMSNLLQKLDLDAKSNSYLDGITKSAKNLIVVVNDILDFSKISSDNLHLEKIPIDLEEEFSQVKTLFQVKSTEKDIDLIFDISPDISGLKLEGDPVRLNQILNNLLGNALKFTPQGTVTFSVGVKCQSQNEITLAFSIEDTGIGIAEEDQDIIFIPFSQADSSTTRKYGGTGLGLSITHRLVTLMGGDLSLCSKEGEGTKFCFELPFPIIKIDEVEQVEEISTSKVLPVDFKVLLVEDNPMNQLYASSILEGYTSKVTVANDGVEAIEILQKDLCFDIILMDVQMPRMGGEECTQLIRNELKLTTPIIALTANAFKKDQDRYLKNGMDAYLSKPFEEDNLFDVLHRFL